MISNKYFKKYRDSIQKQIDSAEMYYPADEDDFKRHELYLKSLQEEMRILTEQRKSMMDIYKAIIPVAGSALVALMVWGLQSTGQIIKVPKV